MNIEINAYSNARKEINKWLDNHDIPRNDNIVGRIGEYFAIDYIKSTYPIANIIVASKSNQGGYDFLFDGNRYSVKTITKEQKFSVRYRQKTKCVFSPSGKDINSYNLLRFNE
jgi:hypothetical protein